MATEDVANLVQRIVARPPKRAEAQLQADLYGLLTSGALRLATEDVVKLEAPTEDGSRRRLDIEVGHCCIEVKKDLRTGNVLESAREQLMGYVTTRAKTMGERYVGVITDGIEWHLYRLDAGSLVEVTTYVASPTKPDALLIWLESVLATDKQVPATPTHVRERLGVESPAHQLDHATLQDLYHHNQDMPELQVKKDLWAKLLRTAFGSAFDESQSLFIDHTLLVLTAEAIAHAVLGFDLTAGAISPVAIARGTEFHNAQIYGVVEEDFFDWVLEVDGGAEFVAGLARRVGRFDWSSDVNHDVLKALYTSVLPSTAREALGEYYTPDWLAERMVSDIYTDPLHQRLLEPACGSGTFLLHAVRHYLATAERHGVSPAQAVKELTSHVIGMDVHPVSVILARVTYLMAIGRERLAESARGPVTVPVYLGDSIQWEQHTDLLAGVTDITVTTQGEDLVSGGGGMLFGDDLKFPVSVLGDAGNFDRLVSTMADKATTDRRAARDVMRPVLRQRGVHDSADQAMLIETFETMRRLHQSGRNHIWGYYVRNLIRPVWLSDPGNRVDVLIGNPPWLRYSKMTRAMQERYKTLAKDRNLLSGKLGASGRDLATLFVARAVELYLRGEGVYSFVMPHGTLTRRPHEGFRSGDWGPKGTAVNVTFMRSWDLDKVSTGFPMSSCVITGRRTDTAAPLATEVLRWHGFLTNPDVTWDVASDRVTTEIGDITTLSRETPASGYKAAFRQGAILVPRYLLFVDEVTASNPLGAGAGRVHVQSHRTTQEKDPWKSQPSLHGSVERRFLHDVYLGENVAPFRTLSPRRSVLPVNHDHILTPNEIEEAEGLSEWWSNVEHAWESNRKASETKPLLERFDYHRQLSAQLPGATHRVLYTKAGNTLAAARLEIPDAVIDHKLYWAATASASEARYLVAILNSTTLLEKVTPLQAKGLYGPRDFDKYVFEVGIPTFNPANDAHVAIATLAKDAETVAQSVPIDPTARFQTTRKLIREAIDSAGLTERMEKAIAELLPPTPQKDEDTTNRRG